MNANLEEDYDLFGELHHQGCHPAGTKATPTGLNSTGMLLLFPLCLTNCPASRRKDYIKCHDKDAQNVTLIQLLQLPELLPLAGWDPRCPTYG